MGLRDGGVVFVHFYCSVVLMVFLYKHSQTMVDNCNLSEGNNNESTIKSLVRYQMVFNLFGLGCGILMHFSFTCAQRLKRIFLLPWMCWSAANAFTIAVVSGALLAYGEQTANTVYLLVVGLMSSSFYLFQLYDFLLVVFDVCQFEDRWYEELESFWTITTLLVAVLTYIGLGGVGVTSYLLGTLLLSCQYFSWGVMVTVGAYGRARREEKSDALIFVV